MAQCYFLAKVGAAALKGLSSFLPSLLASLPLLASCFSFSAVDSDGPICMQRQAGERKMVILRPPKDGLHLDGTMSMTAYR